MEITWQAPEFEKQKKPRGWYVSLWILFAALAAVGLITGSVLMLILMVLAALVVSVYAAKEPRMLSVRLQIDSLFFADKVYDLKDFESFWIFERSPFSTLSLNAKKRLRPHLKVLLPADKVQEVRQLLAAPLQEREQEESLTEALADKLKF